MSSGRPTVDQGFDLGVEMGVGSDGCSIVGRRDGASGPGHEVRLVGEGFRPVLADPDLVVSGLGVDDHLPSLAIIGWLTPTLAMR